MDILNSLNDINRLDSIKMLMTLWNFPDQCREAYKIGSEAPLPAGIRVKNIMVTGLGGSGIGGDLLRTFTLEKMSVPVIVNREYTLPAFIDQDSLVFVVSYSGNTEETISAYIQARARKAKILVLTTGGKLKDMAENDHIPVILIPGGISPRSATGYLFIPMLVIMERLGMISGIKEEVDELVEQMKLMRKELAPEISTEKNLSKQLAARLYRKIPVIWGSSVITGVVAQRWKCQFNENTKTPAYWNVFPELNHNEIVGFEATQELLKQLFIIILSDKGDHIQVQKRIAITRTVVEKSAAGINELHSVGSGVLTRLYSLIYIGDYTSIYLAVLYGIDPGPVKVIDRLKTELTR